MRRNRVTLDALPTGVVCPPEPHENICRDLENSAADTRFLFKSESEFSSESIIELCRQNEIEINKCPPRRE